MTTVAMGASMLPIALKIGADADFRAAMAIAVIGGLITSTLLSLFYVPVMFTYVDDARRWVVRMFSRKPIVISLPRLRGRAGWGRSRAKSGRQRITGVVRCRAPCCPSVHGGG